MGPTSQVVVTGRIVCGGFRSETATWIQKWFKTSVGASRMLQTLQFFFFFGNTDMSYRIYEVKRGVWVVFLGGNDGRGHRNVHRIPQWPNLNERHWCVGGGT
jgi:hypothetical protein